MRRIWHRLSILFHFAWDAIVPARSVQRERRRSGLAVEARSLMQNEEYAQEAQEVAGLMEQLRGPR